MCIVAVKYFPEIGWVGVKNRDRNYQPVIIIKQSFRQDIERMYILDKLTKYTEGLNEYGICILSSAVATKRDEKEGNKGRSKSFASPDGKKVRTALFEKDIDDAVNVIIKSKLPGNTIVFNKERAILIEAAYSDSSRENFVFKQIEISKDKNAVRTNHGILISWAGYQPSKDNLKEQASRESSEARLSQVLKDIQKVKDSRRMLDCISNTENNDPQLNPLRMDDREGKLRTTGQIMIIPSELTLYYRPVHCKVEFDFDKINSGKSKTFFQILSSREILKRNYVDYEKCVANILSKIIIERE